jgi:O-antigen/teichoic acid export membrane protein
MAFVSVPMAHLSQAFGAFLGDMATTNAALSCGRKPLRFMHKFYNIRPAEAFQLLLISAFFGLSFLAFSLLSLLEPFMDLDLLLRPISSSHVTGLRLYIGQSGMHS